MRFITFLECPKNDTTPIKLVYKRLLALNDVLGVNYRTGAAIDRDKAKIWFIVKSPLDVNVSVWMQVAQRLGGCYIILFDLEKSNVWTMKIDGEIRCSYSEHMNWHRGLARLVPAGVNISALVSFATDDFPIYDEALQVKPKDKK